MIINKISKKAKPPLLFQAAGAYINFYYGRIISLTYQNTLRPQVTHTFHPTSKP
jgi:hypothetical protein